MFLPMLLLAAASASDGKSSPTPLLTEPALSPNHTEIAFVSGGDIWTVPAGGGDDLDTENQSREGVVIDIRNNNGGFVNAYALDIFTRQPYLTMTPRNHPSSPARSMLGQRSLELPTVLVVNQNSLSDAEDFTEGYRAMKLGKVVGVPTAGWIIYTGSAELIDGSVLRRPFIKVTANDGTDMELHPRPVDVEVNRPMGESYIGHDTQLDQAVNTLLSGIDSKTRRKTP